MQQLVKSAVVLFAVLVAMVSMSYARSISTVELESDDADEFSGVIVARRINKPRGHVMNTRHFANHVLCRRQRDYFEKALKENYFMKESFTEKLVDRLCRSRGVLLDMFVSDVFDKNGDGYINGYEKSFYWYRK